MNVNQSEDESGPNAAVLLWSTQAEQHLTENFLIAPWSRSINGLAPAIICPRFLSFERDTIVRHTSKPRQSFPLLWVIWGVWMLLIYHPVSIKIYGSDYGSASPNQTAFIRPLFILCCSANNSRMCSCFHLQPPEVKHSLGNKSQRICRIISQNNYTTHFPVCDTGNPFVSCWRHCNISRSFSLYLFILWVPSCAVSASEKRSRRTEIWLIASGGGLRLALARCWKSVICNL